MTGFVGLMLAKGYPALNTERGTIRPGETLVVPVEFAAVLLERDPIGWALATPKDAAAVKAVIDAQKAPITSDARADKER